MSLSTCAKCTALGADAQVRSSLLTDKKFYQNLPGSSAFDTAVEEKPSMLRFQETD